MRALRRGLWASGCSAWPVDLGVSADDEPHVVEAGAQLVGDVGGRALGSEEGLEPFEVAAVQSADGQSVEVGPGCRGGPAEGFVCVTAAARWQRR